MTNACLPCRLGKTYAVLWAGNRFVGSETPKHNAFDLENLNFIPNIFQETHGFSVLTDSVITCIYLRRSQRKVLWRKNHLQTFSWPGKSTSAHLKVAIILFGPNSEYLSGPFADFCCRKGISYFTLKIWLFISK